jgi:site-specific recombinase XerC
VPKFRKPGHRLNIATDDERERILAAANPSLSLFLHLCLDLGLRHQTAARINLTNYNKESASLTFTTKGNRQQTLPVSNAIQALIEKVPPGADPTTPIVNLLPGIRKRRSQRPNFQCAWKKHKAELGITRQLRIHDLRRTLAEEVWDATNDLRKVQAQLGHANISTTAIYLANRLQLEELTPVQKKVQAMRDQRAQRKQQQA